MNTPPAVTNPQPGVVYHDGHSAWTYDGTQWVILSGSSSGGGSVAAGTVTYTWGSHNPLTTSGMIIPSDDLYFEAKHDQPQVEKVKITVRGTFGKMINPTLTADSVSSMEMTGIWLPGRFTANFGFDVTNEMSQILREELDSKNMTLNLFPTMFIGMNCPITGQKIREFELKKCELDSVRIVDGDVIADFSYHSGGLHLFRDGQRI